MSQVDGSLWAPILAGTAGAVFVAVIGGAATDIGPWYAALKKPSWQPPNWLFGPVWTTIFALCVVAGVIAWRNAATDEARFLIIGLFVVNGLLNIAWSVLFFSLRRPDWALIEVAALWFSILALIIAFFPISRLSALLLAPYLVWVSIASFLNWTIVSLNSPFGLTGSPS